MKPATRRSLLGLGTGDAAKLLGVAPGTLRKWADAGSIRCVRTPGGQRRYRVEELERFAGQERSSATSSR